MTSWMIAQDNYDVNRDVNYTQTTDKLYVESMLTIVDVFVGVLSVRHLKYTQKTINALITSLCENFSKFMSTLS